MSGMPLPRKDVSPSEMALNTSEAMPTPSREEEHVGDTENMIVLPTPSEVSNASTQTCIKVQYDRQPQRSGKFVLRGPVNARILGRLQLPEHQQPNIQITVPQTQSPRNRPAVAQSSSTTASEHTTVLGTIEHSDSEESIEDQSEESGHSIENYSMPVQSDGYRPFSESDNRNSFLGVMEENQPVNIQNSYAGNLHQNLLPAAADPTSTTYYFSENSVPCLMHFLADDCRISHNDSTNWTHHVEQHLERLGLLANLRADQNGDFICLYKDSAPEKPCGSLMKGWEAFLRHVGEHVDVPIALSPTGSEESTSGSENPIPQARSFELNRPELPPNTRLLSYCMDFNSSLFTEKETRGTLMEKAKELEEGIEERASDTDSTRAFGPPSVNPSPPQNPQF